MHPLPHCSPCAAPSKSGCTDPTSSLCPCRWPRPPSRTVANRSHVSYCLLSASRHPPLRHARRAARPHCKTLSLAAPRPTRLARGPSASDASGIGESTSPGRSLIKRYCPVADVFFLSFCFKTPFREGMFVAKHL